LHPELARRIVKKMNLLCVFGRHQWKTAANAGEDPYQWCQRCHRYRSTINARRGGEPTGRGRPSGGRSAGLVDGGGFDGGGFDGGGGYN
jgi:uncharacterized membrane protein YgcG